MFSTAKQMLSPDPTLLSRCYTFLLGLSFRTHCLVSTLCRLALILFGEVHDTHSEVLYTDVDYKVVKDGARHVLQGYSPFLRHTYRYSPMLAYLQLPSVLLHPTLGKVIYVSFDIFVALLIYTLVRTELHSQYRKAVQSLLSKFGKIPSPRSFKESDERNRSEVIASISACFWLYNPLTAVISTRGNGDSFSCFFVILTIYLLIRSERSDKAGCLIFTAGLAHGVAIHLRLYPLLFSLAYFLCLSDRFTGCTQDFLRQLLSPSREQLLLILGTVISLFTVTGFFYRLYGWQYLYEAYIYHFIRKDVRHNFSLYFLMQYLSGSAEQLTLLEKLIIAAPQFFLLLYLTFSFGQFGQTLPFCIFSLSFVIVTFNSVVTSQYFVWYLALLPLCLNNLQSLSMPKAVVLFCLWFLAQGFWLLPAYLLEFKAWNTFHWIGVQGVLLFLLNNFLIICLIEHYSFTFFKVNFKKLI